MPLGRLSAPLVALAALAQGCGDAPRPQTASTLEVRGAPLRAPAPPVESAAPAAPLLGDVDSASPTAAAPGAADVSASMSLAPVGAASRPAPAAARPSNPEPAAEAYDDYPAVTFEELAGFDYALYAEDTKNKHEVPAKIQALSGKRVAVEGFMMPLSYEAGGLKKFLLMKSQYGCCFASTPKINEWVEVTMQGGATAEHEQHVLATVWGVLEVTPETREGMFTGLYRMKATRVELTEAK
jgi:hypothetical protein